MSHTVDYNAIPMKTVEQIALLRIAGQISARVLEELTPHIQPGVSSRAINDLAHSLIVEKYGAEIDREDFSGRHRNSVQLLMSEVSLLAFRLAWQFDAIGRVGG